MDPKIIYVESEDDITDVIGKLKQTGAKTIQLTPVRGSIALKSLINLRILLRTAKQAGQTISIATSDPTIRRLATTANIETLSASGIREEPISDPETEKVETKETETEEIVEETKEPGKKSIKKITRKTEEQEEEVIVSSDLEDKQDDEEEEEKAKKVPSFDKYRKWIIIGAVALIVLIGFIVWATIFAPRVDITAYIKTTKRSLSDYFTNSITFTDKEADESIADAKFLLEEHTISDKSSVDFEATGEKNIGNTATGTITVSRTGSSSTSALTIAKGATIKHGDKSYTVSEDLSLRGATASSDVEICNITDTCFKDGVITGALKVTANGQGASFNTSETSGWTIKSGTFVTATAISGGTDKIVKIITDEDVRKATDSLTTNGLTCSTENLPLDWPENLLVVRDTKTATTGTPTSIPKVGEEVREGVTPKLEAESKCTLYGIEKAKINSFIEEKVNASISNETGRKIFSTGIENAWMAKRTADDKGRPQTAKLETNSIQIGPALTVEDIFEYAQGRPVNEVNNWLRTQNGVTNVQIDVSFFWVSRIPSDVNKVNISLESSE